MCSVVHHMITIRTFASSITSLKFKDYDCYMIQLIKQNQPTSGVLHLVVAVIYAFYTLLCSTTRSSIHPQFGQVRAETLSSQNRSMINMMCTANLRQIDLSINIFHNRLIKKKPHKLTSIPWQQQYSGPFHFVFLVLQ